MPGAVSKSNRASRGTSATATSTEATTPALSTEPATVRPRRTAKRAKAPEQPAEVSQPGGLEPTDLTVVGAVRRDLADIRLRAPAVASSTLAMSALALAREMDEEGNSATSKSMCARALLDTMDRLRELCPPEEKTDGVDELRRRRERRLAGQSGTTA